MSQWLATEPVSEKRIRFVLYQYYHCHVTQPLLLEQLDELDIDISAGQPNNLLIEEKDRFHGVAKILVLLPSIQFT
jgi:hypothetical protein